MTVKWTTVRLTISHRWFPIKRSYDEKKNQHSTHSLTQTIGARTLYRTKRWLVTHCVTPATWWSSVRRKPIAYRDALISYVFYLRPQLILILWLFVLIRARSMSGSFAIFVFGFPGFSIDINHFQSDKMEFFDVWREDDFEWHQITLSLRQVIYFNAFLACQNKNKRT